jgi:hypothetical protein
MTPLDGTDTSMSFKGKFKWPVKNILIHSSNSEEYSLLTLFSCPRDRKI